MATWATAFALALGEILLRWLFPLPYIVPATDWSAAYGPIAHSNARIVHAKPGGFSFVYTTNRLRYRGPEISPDSPTEKIVLLGDSNIFGFGVNDDQTISAHLNRRFKGRAEVVNLGNGGWSLPQEVRRYLELGQSFNPVTVMLYFASNDIKDDVYGVSWVSYADDDGTIQLRDAPPSPAGRLRTLLPADSWAYRALFSLQLFARVKLFLNRMAMTGFREPTLVSDTSPEDGQTPIADQVIVMDRSENERRYIELLRAFSVMLSEQKRRFVILSDDQNFTGYEKVATTVRALQREHLIEHYPLDRWFVAGKDYPTSPEGHRWGKEAVRALAKHLVADVLSRHQ